jgi:hypothetical protein
VEGRFGKLVSGQAVAVAAGAVGAKVLFTAVAQLFGKGQTRTHLSTESSRLALLVWLGGWGVTSIVVS